MLRVDANADAGVFEPSAANAFAHQLQPEPAATQRRVAHNATDGRLLVSHARSENAEIALNASVGCSAKKVVSTPIGAVHVEVCALLLDYEHHGTQAENLIELVGR